MFWNFFQTILSFGHVALLFIPDFGNAHSVGVWVGLGQAFYEKYSGLCDIAGSIRRGASGQC